MNKHHFYKLKLKKIFLRMFHLEIQKFNQIQLTIFKYHSLFLKDSLFLEKKIL
jgi:hypothetical protein